MFNFYLRRDFSRKKRLEFLKEGDYASLKKYLEETLETITKTAYPSKMYTNEEERDYRMDAVFGTIFRDAVDFVRLITILGHTEGFMLALQETSEKDYVRGVGVLMKELMERRRQDDEAGCGEICKK